MMSYRSVLALFFCLALAASRSFAGKDQWIGPKVVRAKGPEASAEGLLRWIGFVGAETGKREFAPSIALTSDEKRIVLGHGPRLEIWCSERGERVRSSAAGL